MAKHRSPEVARRKDTEIERRFFVSADKLMPDVLDSAYAVLALEQGYYFDAQGRKRRLRQQMDMATGETEYVMTKKKRIAPRRVEREEKERPLSKEEFEALWPHTEGWRIAKLRYCFAHGNNSIHLDIFADSEGVFAIAEIEYHSVKAADDPWQELPAWFGEVPQEITEEGRWGCSDLARYGRPDRAYLAAVE